MNRHERRTFISLTRRKSKERPITSLHIDLGRLEKQPAITEIQAEYLREILDIYKRQKINTHPKATRVARILTKPRCKSLREIHEKIIKPKPKEIIKPKKEKNKTYPDKLMYWLSIIIIAIILSFIFYGIVYGQSTKYDKKQDKKIDRNKQNIIKEIDNRKKADKKLSKKIVINKSDIVKNKKTIKQVDKKHVNWNVTQDTLLQSHSNKIDEVGNRVNELEKTQYVIEPEVRVLDTRKLEVKPFLRYNFTREKVDVVGIRFTFKIGKSYEEKLIETLEARLKQLEEK